MSETKSKAQGRGVKHYDTKEVADRFPADTKLRSLGYSIHRRRRGLPVQWRAPDGAVVTQEEALAYYHSIHDDAENCGG